MSVRLLRGFNYLGQLPAATPASALRSTVLGTLLGALSAWAWMAAEREAVEVQREDQRALRTHIKAAELVLTQAVEQASLAQDKRKELTRLQSWQVSRLQVLDSLEAMASSAGAHLTRLRYEGLALNVEGHMPAAQMEPWAQAVSARLPGWSAAELVELETLVPPVSAGVHVRFVLRWSAPPQQAAP